MMQTVLVSLCQGSEGQEGQTHIAAFVCVRVRVCVCVCACMCAHSYVSMKYLCVILTEPLRFY